MSVNLLEKVQQNLGYPPLRKIDPNTDQLSSASLTQEHLFSQAAIPAVLTALYKYVQGDKGAEEVLRGDTSTDWVGRIFHDHHKDAVAKVKAFTDGDAAHSTSKMNSIANEAIKVTKENLAAGAGIKEVKAFFLNQRNNILPYLPPELNLGDLLNDTTIDDNVNKMEGPISSLMKGIGSAFSNPVTSDDVNKF
jgi:hypothetical protein